MTDEEEFFTRAIVSTVVLLMTSYQHDQEKTDQALRAVSAGIASGFSALCGKDKELFEECVEILIKNIRATREHLEAASKSTLQ